MRFPFGKVITTNIDGNIISQVEENIANGTPVSLKRIRYEERTKVHNSQEEYTEYMHFSEFIHSCSDKKVLSPEFRIEFSKQGNQEGYYYVVKCWSALDYSN